MDSRSALPDSRFCHSSFMKAFVSLLGIIGEYAGSGNLELDVEEGATVGDLLGEIGDRVGGGMPPDLWDPERRAFSPMVSVFLDGKDAEDSAPLREGSEVILLSMIAGGSGRVDI
ncbi:MAG: MoaD/ThiS family protein [Chloroflexi bacterium]|nr:MoaD/ThiS family protein [Chloroflexota bacterium]